MLQNTLPDYHFLLVAPNIGAEWFFEAARRYWERFRPTVVSDLAILAYVPPDAEVVVTVLARRDIVAELGVQVAQARPNAFFDAVTFDLLDDLKAVLDGRAETNAPFGVPLAAQAPINPTPGALLGDAPPTREPGGFITQTPTPTQPSVMPTPSAPQVPINPTPGPLIGG